MEVKNLIEKLKSQGAFLVVHDDKLILKYKSKKNTG